jgi:4-amino-4-deoxy-L-arabinose transferase-like glycosyltransferase
MRYYQSLNIPRSILIITLCAFLTRLLILGEILASSGSRGLMTNDSYGFLATAKNLTAGHGFSKSTEPPFSPDAHFPPIYPLLMAGSLAASSSLIPLVFLQIVLSSLMPLAVWRIGKFFTARRGVSTSAAALMAFEPMNMVWSVLVLTETVAVFFLLLGVYYFLKLIRGSRASDAAWGGLFLALSTLTRPHGQFIFILAAIYLGAAAIQAVIKIGRGGGKNKQREGEVPISTYSSTLAPFKNLAAFFAVFFLVLSPWLIRNHMRFGSASIATTGLRNVYSSLAASALSLSTGEPIGEVKNRLAREFAQKYHVDPIDIKEDPSLGKALAKEGFVILKDHPKESLEAAFISIQTFFTQDLWTDYLRRFGVLPHFEMDFSPSVILFTEGPLPLAKLIWERLGFYSIIPAIGRIFWIALGIGWIAGTIRAARKGREEKEIALMMSGVILVYALSSIVGGFSDQGRLRYPVNPFIFLLASYAALEALRTMKFRIAGEAPRR